MFKKLGIILSIIITLFINNLSFAAEKEEETAPLKGSAVIINLKSDKIKYFPEKDQFVATGNVKIIVEDQSTTIESDEVIYDKTNEMIISEKNVKINKHGTIINGDYAKFDLTKDCAIIENPDADLVQIRIDATTAEIVSKDIELLKGKASLNQKDMVMILSTGAFGANTTNKFLQHRPDANPHFKYDIKAKEILIDQYDYYNIITLKNSTIKINKFKIAKIPVMQLTTEKETNRIETMLPEFGSRKELGAYFGHGHVFHVYKGSTLKALPIFTFDSDGVGVGGMGRFMSRTNRTELLYSSLKDKFIVQGEQDLNFLTPDTKLLYGTNSYVDNGFFGGQNPQYIVEVVDQRKIAEAYNFQFGLRSSAGFAEELGNFSTGKFQLQGSLANVKPLLGYNKYLELGLASNFSICAYGTGHTYGVVRAGPTVASSLGPLYLWAAYYQGGIYGHTPFLYDRYLYGKSNVVFSGNMKITKYLSLGYLTSLNLTKDNWNQELLTENQIYVWVGPEELKFKLGYDTKRERAVWGLDMMVGSDTSAFEFDKLKVKQK